PLIPFYLINVAAAMSPMPTRRYFVASVIGLLPSTFLYAMVGHSLGSWIEAKAAWDQGDVLGSSLMGVLGALGLLAVLSTWGARRLGRLKADRGITSSVDQES
ncbi:MAG TPA: VTT domain-containing protein, partial [Wenzhouxiangella sp.]